jgi:hypothetical protein
MTSTVWKNVFLVVLLFILLFGVEGAGTRTHIFDMVGQKLKVVAPHTFVNVPNLWFYSVAKVILNVSPELLYQLFCRRFPEAARIPFDQFQTKLQKFSGPSKKFPIRITVLQVLDRFKQFQIEKAAQLSYRRALEGIWEARFIFFAAVTQSITKLNQLSFIMSSQSTVERDGSESVRRNNLNVGHIKAPKLVGVTSAFRKVEQEVLRLKLILPGTFCKSSECIFDRLQDVIKHIVNQTKVFTVNPFPLHARLYLLIWGDGATPAREGWFAEKVWFLSLPPPPQHTHVYV